MGFLYICTLILLGIAFMCFKKSDEKLNFIKWICIFIAGIYAYNITVCMILGILHITQNIWLLSIINAVISAALLYKPIKNKEIQKYKCSKLDIIAIILICVFFVVMFVKDLYIWDGNVSHWAVDSAIHYRAAQHYSEDLKLFPFDEDKTFFNFNIMQTGAYINDGIFMNGVNSVTNLDKVYSYQMFETLTMFIGGLALYAFFADRIKTKRGLIGSLILFGLYMYGYPYLSWMYGFSYLSVGIAMIALLLSIVEMLFTKENIKKFLVITLIAIVAMGLIFSYCLFVPAIFSAICIYVFLEELKDKNSKKYLKIFGKNTLIVTGLLLLVTIFGIGYLFIPSFIIEGQKNLVSALQDEGGIYSEKYVNFLAYVPFAIIFLYELVKKIKEKELKFLDVLCVILTGYLALFYLGMLANKVSSYYMLKIYFAEWIVVFAVSIDILNNNIDKKIFRLDVILLVALFAYLVVKGKSIETIFKIFFLLVLVFFTTLPQDLKQFDFGKLKIRPLKVTPVVYAICIGILICSWVWLKSGHILGEAEKHGLVNLVGMYYTENCDRRKAVDVMQNFNSDNILITRYAKENLEDMTADNTLLITEGGAEGSYKVIWAIATLEYSSDYLTFRDIMKMTNKHDLQDGLENQGIKYIIRLDSNHQAQMEECKENIEEIKNAENAEVLYSNEHGFVARVNR